MNSWADNTLNYLHGTAAINMGKSGRLTGYVALGQGKSDPTLQSFTINTAVNEPALARPTSQAESQMTIAQFTFASRPIPRLAFNAKYRYADVDIQTPIFDRPGGYVAYDSKLGSAPASSSEYHSVTRNNFDVEGSFELLPFTSLKVGYGTAATDYQNRLWDSNSENVFRVSLDTTGNQYFMLRALYEDRTRTGDNFQPQALEEVGELTDMRHFDVANRDRTRYTFIATATPGSHDQLQRLGRRRPRQVSRQRTRLAELRFESVLGRLRPGAGRSLRSLGELRLGGLLVAAALAQRVV